MNKAIIKSLFIIIALLTVAAGSTNAYFSDSKVISGNVFSTGTWATIVINEVYYLGDKEWIELYNVSNSTVDIKGWQLCDSTNNCGSLNPAQKTDVAPNGYVLVSHDNNDLKDWDIAKTVTHINYAGGKIVFEDTGDAVILKDKADVVIDQMSYGDNITALNPACITVVIGHSLQRTPTGTDTNTAADFKDQATPTPGM